MLALIDGDDREHGRCARVAEETSEQFVVPALTLPEVDYLLRKRGRGDVWTALVADIASGSYRLHPPGEQVFVRAAELEEEYHDLRLGVVDASVIATCEALGETKVATLDHRHFSVVRPRHCEALTVLPT